MREERQEWGRHPGTAGQPPARRHEKQWKQDTQKVKSPKVKGRQREINLEELVRNERKLGWAFLTNKSLCCDLGAGWWTKRKSLLQKCQYVFMSYVTNLLRIYSRVVTYFLEPKSSCLYSDYWARRPSGASLQGRLAPLSKMQPRFMGTGVECPDRLSLFCATALPHSTRLTMYSSTSLIFSLLLLAVGSGSFQSAQRTGQRDPIHSAGSVSPGSYCSTDVYGFCRELDDPVGRNKDTEPCSNAESLLLVPFRWECPLHKAWWALSETGEFSPGLRRYFIKPPFLIRWNTKSNSRAVSCLSLHTE